VARFSRFIVEADDVGRQPWRDQHPRKSRRSAGLLYSEPSGNASCSSNSQAASRCLRKAVLCGMIVDGEAADRRSSEHRREKAVLADVEGPAEKSLEASHTRGTLRGRSVATATPCIVRSTPLVDETAFGSSLRSPVAREETIEIVAFCPSRPQCSSPNLPASWAA